MKTHKLLLPVLLAAAFSALAQHPFPMQSFQACVLVPVPWADGDSFLVRLPDGREQTVRLYGVDCIEMHIQGDTNARRLRDQRRYFSIADIRAARTMGAAAHQACVELLARPFTVHTAFADGRGDGRFPRVYAFVTTADGADLAEALVSRGLARAYGVTRQRPDGTLGAEWRERLKDLELVASRSGAGAWKLTDWERLPKERQEARDERAELLLAQGAFQAEEDQPIDVNRATREELISVPGIGPKLADEIIRARPFKEIEDLRRVNGIGPVTLERISPFIALNPDPVVLPNPEP